MENAKGKGKVRLSKSKPKKNYSTNNSETGMAASEHVVVNGKELVIVSEGENKEENAKEEGSHEENIEEVEKNKENTKEEVKHEEKVEANPKEKVNKSRKRSRKRKRTRNTDAIITKDEDEPESSCKKATKKVEGMGMIFMCSSKTKKDCYRYKVLGLPASKKEIVSKIYKGMRLFLFDCDLKLLYGIYKAAGPGGYNLEPKAFNSAFPSQVQFTVLDDCLPLAEEKFKKVIKDNYFTKNKFNCQLTSEQVKNLCKLFKVPSKGSKSKQLGRSREAEARSFVDRDRIRRRDREEERHHASRPVVYDREAFASPVVRLPLYQPLPPPLAPALPPSYAYNRTLEADVYRRDPRLEHHDRQLLDLELRRRDEIERYDPYILSRERPLYRDPPYSAGGQPEYLPPAGLPPEYRHPVDPPLEYRPLAGQPPVYDPYRPLYRY